MIVNLDNPTREKQAYEMPQRGWHAATITDCEDLGIVHHDTWGDSHKMKITIRLDDELTTTGWPKIVCHWCPVSDSPRSKLGRFLNQLGLKGKVDTDCLIGMEISCKVIWTMASDGTDKMFAKIGQVSRVSRVTPNDMTTTSLQVAETTDTADTTDKPWMIDKHAREYIRRGGQHVHQSDRSALCRSCGKDTRYQPRQNFEITNPKWNGAPDDPARWTLHGFIHAHEEDCRD